MILTFIRHGQTVGNEQKIVNGHADDKLNAAGIQQAKELGVRMKDEEVDCIRSSDSSRAYDTAQLICEYAGRDKEIYTDSRLRERSFGSYEGNPDDNLAQDVKNSGLLHYQFFENSPLIEKSDAMIIRRQAWFKETMKGKSYNHVVIVTHGSIIRVIAGHLLGMTVDEFRSHFAKVDNCCRVVIDLDRKKVLKFNA